MYPISVQQAMTAGSATVGGYKEAVKQAVVQAPPDGDPTGERGDPEPEEQAAEGEQAPAPSKHRAREEFWSSAPQIIEGARRGDSSRRSITNAYEECTFPAYPESALPHGDFALPKGMIDNQAPVSARKWELALNLATLAKGLAGKRQAAHERLFNGQADAHDVGVHPDR